MPIAASRRRRAIEVGKLLQDHGIGHFEEPCPYWELAQTKEVSEALDIDVTGGEQDCDLALWRAHHRDARRRCRPAGCLLSRRHRRTLQVAEMAAEAGLPVTPHCRQSRPW